MINDRLREAYLIHDEHVQEETLEAIKKFPDYFWEVAAASSYRHHNPFSCAKHGLWIHTKMVCTSYIRMVSSDVASGNLTEFEADCGLAACILHDSWKGGKDGNPEGSAVKDHDLIAADFIRDETDLPEMVASAVESHMGPWYAGPEPETRLDKLVHYADMTASTKNGHWGLYKPADELVKHYPSLPQAYINKDGMYK